MNELSSAPVVMDQEGEQITRRDLADAVRSMGLLASLKISLWSGERTDTRISTKVKADAGAVGNTGRYIKNLLAGCDNKLKDVRGAYTAARTMHYKLTLPWVSDGDDRQQGPRLLPNLLFQKYLVEMSNLRKTAEDKLADFIADYPVLVQQAMANLAGLATPEDYPDAQAVSDCFKFHFDFDPIPPSNSFINLPDDALTALSRALKHKQEISARAAEAAMWERVHEHIKHLADRLATPDATFKEATVENVRELMTLLPGYNCTGDPRVDDVIQDISTMLDGIDAKEIRKDAQLRGSVAVQAKQLSDKLQAWGL
jgi:hypothetical protein